jgi:hypothetical protein
MISYKECVEAFEYSNGVLTWKKTFSNRAIQGTKITRTNVYGYVPLGFKGKKFLAHQIIFMLHHGFYPKTIDHINGIKNDNRIENLRQIETYQNCCNRLPRFNELKYKGVSPTKNKKWRSRIRFNGKEIFIGTFETKDEAAIAYKEKAIELQQEFSIYLSRNLNEI